MHRFCATTAIKNRNFKCRNEIYYSIQTWAKMVKKNVSPFGLNDGKNDIGGGKSQEKWDKNVNLWIVIMIN